MGTASSKLRIPEVRKMTLKQMLDKRSNGKAGSLLKGSDVPPGTKSITIGVAAIRESPEGFGAPAIIDLKTPVYGKSAWPVNKTNEDAHQARW